MLTGIIVFCISFGVVLSQLGEQAHTMVNFFYIMDQVIMRLVMLIMWYTFMLIAGKKQNWNENTLSLILFFILTNVILF